MLEGNIQKYNMNVFFSDFFVFWPWGFVMTVLFHNFTVSCVNCPFVLLPCIIQNQKRRLQWTSGGHLIFSLVKGWNQIYLQYSWQWPVFGGLWGYTGGGSCTSFKAVSPNTQRFLLLGLSLIEHLTMWVSYHLLLPDVPLSLWVK